MARIRFLKTGAEAVAAAVRLARVATGREEVLGCGYHGWLDWCQGRADGVPRSDRAAYAELPFNDADRGREMIRYRGDRLAAVVVEPVVAAALATLEIFEREDVCAHLHRVGTQLLHGLHRLQHDYPDVITGVGGVAEMCFLHFVNDDASRRVAVECARRGVLFKRTAYNFVSLAHRESDVERTLTILKDIVAAV